jgi:hypothetical protein
MTRDTQIRYSSPIVEEAAKSITDQERAIFDLNFRISERIYQIMRQRNMTKRELARLTGKKESEVSRWFMLGHNFSCKSIAIIQQALGVPIIEVA